MISLHLKEYCGNCPEFKADVEKEQLCDPYGEVSVIHTTIRCKYRERCERLLKYLQKQKE